MLATQVAILGVTAMFACGHPQRNLPTVVRRNLFLALLGSVSCRSQGNHLLESNLAARFPILRLRFPPPLPLRRQRLPL